MLGVVYFAFVSTVHLPTYRGAITHAKASWGSEAICNDRNRVAKERSVAIIFYWQKIDLSDCESICVPILKYCKWL